MRWKKEIRPVVGRKPLQEQGDVKWITRFAFLPISIINEEFVWLEKYKSLYRWTTRVNKSTLGMTNLDSYNNRLVDDKITGWHWIRNEAL